MQTIGWFNRTVRCPWVGCSMLCAQRECDQFAASESKISAIANTRLSPPAAFTACVSDAGVFAAA
jgi:hypothetical protein